MIRRPPNGGPAALDLDFVRRFGRQLIVPSIGPLGQQRLADARVLVVGLGGLGSQAAYSLAAAGVGELHLMDPDRVELSNLPRQLPYAPEDVGRPKAEVLAERLRSRDARTRVLPDVAEFEPSTAVPRAAEVDLVVDASDNFPTRYLVSDACVRAGRPDVFGAVHQLEGQVATFDARTGPCYRCLFPTPPPADLAPPCGEAGVLGVVPTIIGALQASEAIRTLLAWRTGRESQLVTFDAEAFEFRRFRLTRRTDCDGCAEPVRAGRVPLPSADERVPEGPDGFQYVEPKALAEELGGREPPTLIDVRDAGQRAVVPGLSARWIPADSVAGHLAELADARRPVVICQWGGQAERVGRLLAAAGLRPVRVLRGGLDAYAAEVDPTMARL